LILEGVVDANQVVVSPKVQGILERLNVDEGSSVRAGELTATLDTAELDAEMQAARSCSKSDQTVFSLGWWDGLRKDRQPDEAGRTKGTHQIRSHGSLCAFEHEREDDLVAASPRCVSVVNPLPSSGFGVRGALQCRGVADAGL
jgi:pyruvate/2-oxoglutarate dehydrogenase complex dihydrolipoamide acyltransferase (E2) component